MTDKPLAKPVAKIKMTVTLFDDGTYEKEWAESVVRPEKDVRKHVPLLRVALLLSASRVIADQILKAVDATPQPEAARTASTPPG